MNGVKRRMWAIGATAAAVLVMGSCSDSEEPERGSPTESPSASPEPTSGVEATAYVSDVCGAVVDWTTEIQTLGGELRDAGASATSVQALKRATLTFFSDSVAATDALLSLIEAAGIPDVPRGEEAADHVLDGLTEARRALQGARKQVQGLATNDAQVFARDVQEITAETGRQLSSVGTSLGGFEAPELDEAANQSGVCQDILA
jgi:hypothetical protein